MPKKSDYYLALDKVILTIKTAHKNIENVPIFSDFGPKKAKKHVFSLFWRNFFGFFFAETVVSLIFATIKRQFILFT